jgi:curved DNA-binding protein CbpA
MARTHYEWLEIAENASPEVVRGAFKYLVQRWHPDKNPDNPGLARLILREINEAFEVLSNPDARRKYDLWLKDQRINRSNFDRRRADHGRASHQRASGRPIREKRGKPPGKRKPGVDTWA